MLILMGQDAHVEVAQASPLGSWWDHSKDILLKGAMGRISFKGHHGKNIHLKGTMGEGYPFQGFLLRIHF